jgi:hypothetical protein
MSRPLPWFWIALAALLLLLPMPVGRFVLDLLGGLTLTLLLLPLLAGAAAWIGWQVLRSRLRPCPVCGVSSFATETCPACGASMQGESDMSSAGVSASSSGFDASQVTINVEAVEVEVLDPGPDSPRSQG